MKISLWKRTLIGLGVVLSTLLLPACGGSSSTVENDVAVANGGGNPPPQGNVAPVLNVRVVNTFPHDTNAFTQGLLFANGRLYESTGLVGESTLREVELITGAVRRQVANDPTVFAEGLALRAGRLFQLTLGSGITNVWNLNSFTRETTTPTQVPAWGLTYIESSDRFVLSDGTSTLRYLTGDSFQETSTIQVTDNGAAVDSLNELEFVNGVILANRFLTDEIVGIDPNTGVVLFRANLAGIIDKQAEGLGGNDVLNGIAYDAGQDRLFVTGKRWPSLFQIEILAP